jgi:hypothetical protein
MLQEIMVGTLVWLRDLLHGLPSAGMTIAICVAVLFIALALRCPGCCQEDAVFRHDTL